MVAGRRTTNLTSSTTLDEVVGNKAVSGTPKSRKASIANFAAQLVASGPVHDALTARFCMPTEFNAVGDGVADDSTAMVNWAAACVSSKRQPYLPVGNFKCGSMLDFSGLGGLILGAGEGLSKITFTGSGAGLKCYPTTSAFGMFGLCNLTLVASGAVVTRGVDVQLPNDGAYSNNFRTGFRNVELIGQSGGYFATGIRERNVSYSKRQSVKYWGSSEDAGAGGAYYAGVAWDLDTQVVSDDPALGLSLENIFDGCSVAFADTAVKARGFPEGLHFRDNNFAFVRKGIDAVAQSGTRQPFVSIMGNHINATEFCVLLDRFNQSQIIGNHLARPNGVHAYTWDGIHLDDSLYAIITSNIIVPEIVSIPAGNTTGLRLEGDSWYATVDANQFVGAITADYKPLTVAIRLETGIQGTKFGAQNQYNGLITTPLSDGSGNTTNVLPGLTIQKAGVTQGAPGSVSLLNFNADFNIAVSGGAASVDVV